METHTTHDLAAGYDLPKFYRHLSSVHSKALSEETILGAAARVAESEEVEGVEVERLENWKEYLSRYVSQISHLNHFRKSIG